MKCRVKTVFCDVPALGKYCDSNKFRNLCCDSCTKLKTSTKRPTNEPTELATNEPTESIAECHDKVIHVCPLKSYLSRGLFRSIELQ